MSKLSKLFSANRVVLVAHSVFMVATVAAVFLATVNHSLPSKWQNTVAAAVTLITGIAGGTAAVTKFLDGSQKFDALQSQERLGSSSYQRMSLPPGVFSPQPGAVTFPSVQQSPGNMANTATSSSGQDESVNLSEQRKADEVNPSIDGPPPELDAEDEGPAPGELTGDPPDKPDPQRWLQNRREVPPAEDQI